MTSYDADSDESGKYWEALEIVDEDRKRYKVKWAGTDPATGNPWPDDWTLKSYVTPDLVIAWKRKKASLLKEKRATAAKKAAATRRVRSATASTAISNSRKGKARTRTAVTKVASETSEDEVESELLEESVRGTPRGGGKGKERARYNEDSAEADEESDMQMPETSKELQPVIKVGPPTARKRKFSNVEESPEIPRRQKRRLLTLTQSSDETQTPEPEPPTPGPPNDDEESIEAPSPPQIQATGRSRKPTSLSSEDEAQAAEPEPPSVRGSSHPRESDDDEAVIPSPAQPTPRRPPPREKQRLPLSVIERTIRGAVQSELRPSTVRPSKSWLPSNDDEEDVPSPEAVRGRKRPSPAPLPTPPRNVPFPTLKPPDNHEVGSNASHDDGVLRRMEESFLNLDAQSSPQMRLSPRLRCSQQEIIQETIYPPEDETLHTMSSTQQAIADSQSQPRVVTQTELSPDSELLAKYVKLETEHATLLEKFEDVSENILISEDRISQLEDMLARLRQEGLASLREVYEVKLTMVQDELNKVQKLYHVLLVKDQCTNDEIRRRAACEPELRAKNTEMQKALLQFEEDLVSLHLEVVHLEGEKAKLEKVIEEAHKELRSLRAERDGMQQAARTLREAKEQVQDELREVQGELEESRQTLTELDQLQEEMSQLQFRFEESRHEVEVLREKHQEACRTTEAASREARRLRDQYDELFKEHQEAVANSVALQEANHQSKAEIQDRERETAKLREQVQQLQDRLQGFYGAQDPSGLKINGVKSHVETDVEPVADEDIDPEHLYAACQVVVNGQRCTKRFKSGEAVVRHAFADHYKLTIEGVLS